MDTNGSTLAAAEAAATALGADDSYGTSLVACFAAINNLDDGERPKKPPKLDKRRLSEALVTARTAAVQLYSTAVLYCT